MAVTQHLHAEVTLKDSGEGESSQWADLWMVLLVSQFMGTTKSLMQGNTNTHRLIAQELEGTGLKDQRQEDLIRVGQEGLVTQQQQQHS